MKDKLVGHSSQDIGNSNMCCFAFYVFPEEGGNTCHATAHRDICATQLTMRYNFCACACAHTHTCLCTRLCNFLKLRAEQQAVPIGIALEGSQVTAVGECNPPDDRVDKAQLER